MNDPPATPIVPSGLSTNEETTLSVPGVSVNDIDSNSLTTFVFVDHGIVNVTTGTGATITNNGTGLVRIVGTVAQTNASLAGLTYTPGLNFTGQDTLTVSHQ